MRRSDVKGMLDRLNNLRPHQCLYGMADGIEAQGQDEGFILNPASNGAIRVDGLTEGSVACCFIAYQLNITASTLIKAQGMGFAEWDN